MSSHSLALTEDLPIAAVIGVLLLIAGSLVVLARELRRRERLGVAIGLSGGLAAVAVALAILRPVWVSRDGVRVGPRVVLLVDDSRRLLLPDGATTRRARAWSSVKRLLSHYEGSRLEVKLFGDGALRDGSAGENSTSPRDGSVGSDLVAALRHLRESGERPEAVVIVSDGRMTHPASGLDDKAMAVALEKTDLTLHSVLVTEAVPPDASIRAVHAAGAAVAHQPVDLIVEVGCSEGLRCDSLPVSVREYRQGASPAVLAAGKVSVRAGHGRVRLPITLERAGSRIVEVSLEAPVGDKIPENDSRLLTFTVARERIRMLHVAGRPTYDVRALRMWLKSDQAFDVVTFFILRTSDDDAGVSDDETELALIPFPVHELFTEHLPSFDAVVLQDIDAVQYELAPHLAAIAAYVRQGGGLMMVGGPSAFLGGHYGGTALEEILPVALPHRARSYDTSRFVPRVTSAGRVAPVLRSLRELLGDRLPAMVGSNTLGPARDSAIVLWEHPSRPAAGLRGEATPMPVLAVTESGSGRVVALGVDATYRLAFSAVGASVEGAAYGALYDALMGWLMRDPRYESAHVELSGPCIAGVPAKLVIRRAPGLQGPGRLRALQLGSPGKVVFDRELPQHATEEEVEIEPLEAGGYGVELRIGAAPATRYEFACEAGGEAWSDSRPDPERLRLISDVTGGRMVTHSTISDLPRPRAMEITARRHTQAIVPAWCWTLIASCLLGVHWLVRRWGALR